MNKNVRVKDKTPAGITESEDTGSGALQGSVDAAVISSVSLGDGVSKAFEDSTYEIAYGNIEYLPKSLWMMSSAWEKM